MFIIDKIIDKIKFNEYCKLFSIQFNEQKPKYKNINYKYLVCKIYNKYENMDYKQRVIEEVLLKDKINEYTFSKLDTSVFISAILSFLISFTLYFLKENNMDMFVYISKTLVVFMVYFLIVKGILICIYTIKMGFYNLCLDTLDEYNKINGDPLLEIAAEKHEDNFDKKIFKDLEQIKSFLGV